MDAVFTDSQQNRELKKDNKKSDEKEGKKEDKKSNEKDHKKEDKKEDRKGNNNAKKKGHEKRIDKVFKNPKVQAKWEELAARGVGPLKAVHQIASEECGDENPIVVSDEWRSLFPGIPDKFFRCMVE